MEKLTAERDPLSDPFSSQDMLPPPEDPFTSCIRGLRDGVRELVIAVMVNSRSNPQR